VNSSWKARCSYRDSRGARKQLTAVAKTKSAAITALKDKWHDISSRIITRHDNLENLTVDQLATNFFIYLSEVSRLKKITTDTVTSTHAQYKNHLKPRIGNALVIDCTPAMLTNELLDIITPDGKLLSVAEKCRSLLNEMFSYAVNRNILMVNPAESIEPLGYQAPQPKIWSEGAIKSIRIALRHWESKPPKKSIPIADVYDLTLATACRISEVLGFRWENIYLPDEPDTPGCVLVDKAVVRREGQPNYMGETKNQKKKKLSLPRYAVDILKRRRKDSSGTGLVFLNRKGNPYNRDGLYRAAERAFEQAKRELGIELPRRLPFHTSRRTSLTKVAEHHRLEAATLQGGHSSLRVTEPHYVLRDEMKVIDYSTTLEQFGKTENEKTRMIAIAEPGGGDHSDRN